MMIGLRVRQIGLLVVFAAAPALGIVIPGSVTGVGQDTNALDYTGTSQNGVNLSGVVYLQSSGLFCSGALISPTQILTAAHCYAGSSTTVNFVSSVNSDGSDNFTNIVASASSWIIDPGYTTPGGGADLAIIDLPSAAPASAKVYQLYTGTYTNGSPIVVAGYGNTGTGDTGETGGLSILRGGENAYEKTGGQEGLATDLLLGDFNNGVAANNPLNGPNLRNEVDLGLGDSGGPSFFNGQIIGIHDILDCLSATSNGPCSSPPSVNASPGPNSYYGELFGDTNVEADAAFIGAAITPEPSTWLLWFSAISAVVALKRRSLRG